MDELFKIPSCMGEKSSQLRHVYDKVSIHVRGLERLGVTAEQYGSMLIPVVMSKLPTEIRVQIARLTPGGGGHSHIGSYWGCAARMGDFSRSKTCGWV